MSSNYLVPYWRDDPDYFPPRDERRPAHMAEIRRRKRIDGIVVATAGDKSHSVLLRKEMV